MTFKPLSILAGAALLAAASASVLPAALAAEGGALARGGTQVTTEITASGLEVVRGPAVETRPYTGPETGPDTGPVRLASGERVWFLERESGRLTACTLRFTSTVGRQAIRCASRRLPHGIAARALGPID